MDPLSAQKPSGHCKREHSVADQAACQRVCQHHPYLINAGMYGSQSKAAATQASGVGRQLLSKAVTSALFCHLFHQTSSAEHSDITMHM
jgi:hypothetical protein